MVRKSPSKTSSKTGQIILSSAGILRGMRRLMPVSIFVIPFGLSFGVAAIEQGLSVAQTIGMSAFVFSGTAQFASLDFWPEPMALLSLALVMFAVNARFIITGAALSPWLNQLPLRSRWAALFLLSDPNFTDSHAEFQSGERDAGVLLGGGLVLWVSWVGGTAIGALAGAKIGNLQAYGFDVVMVCFFAASITGRFTHRANIIPAVLAAIVAVSTFGWLPSGWNIILAALTGGIWGAFARVR